jgi:lysozyme family protein
MNFKDSVKIILQHEGGYVNDPADPGGETNFGIAKRFYPNLDIKNLTAEQAEDIYFNKYWLKMKLEGIQNDLLRLHVFDMGVNAGTFYAIKLLQQLVGAKDDGINGPATMLAVNTYKNQAELVEKYKEGRMLYYISLVEKKTEMIKFLKGWIKRVFNTKY